MGSNGRGTATPERVKIYAGTPSEVMEATSRPVTLEEAQKYIGGYVALVSFEMPFWGGKVLMLVDEDGRSKELPVNAFATRLAGQTIVGKAILLGVTEGWA